VEGEVLDWKVWSFSRAKTLLSVAVASPGRVLSSSERNYFSKDYISVLYPGALSDPPPPPYRPSPPFPLLPDRRAITRVIRESQKLSFPSRRRHNLPFRFILLISLCPRDLSGREREGKEKNVHREREPRSREIPAYALPAYPELSPSPFHGFLLVAFLFLVESPAHPRFSSHFCADRTTMSRHKGSIVPWHMEDPPWNAPFSPALLPWGFYRDVSPSWPSGCFSIRVPNASTTTLRSCEKYFHPHVVSVYLPPPNSRPLQWWFRSFSLPGFLSSLRSHWFQFIFRYRRTNQADVWVTRHIWMEGRSIRLFLR